MYWDKVNKLLRNELSAVETYQQAIDKFKHEMASASEFQQLTRMCQIHQDAASKLRSEVQQMGGTPTNDSGAWGTWSKIVMGGAKLLGESASLKALKEGEESGIKDYQSALSDPGIPGNTKTLIQNSLLPQSQQNIHQLDNIMNMKAA